MGVVWSILLSFDNEEWWEDGKDRPRDNCEPLDRINQWIHSGELVDLAGTSFKRGAGNGIDANLFGGGFKHFDIKGFIDVLNTQAWKERAKVQLWVRGAEEGMAEETFTAIKLRTRRAARSKPQPVPGSHTRSRAKGSPRRRNE